MSENKLKYPFNLYWRVVTPKGYRLSFLQEYDVILDEYDLKIRKMKESDVL